MTSTPKIARDDKKPLTAFGYQLDADGAPIRETIRPTGGDYGCDPLGGGKFRMVPSGDVVDYAERNRRLTKSVANPSLCSTCIHRQGDAVRMLTGYCVTTSRCDGCGRMADLCIVQLQKPLVRINPSLLGVNHPFQGTTEQCYNAFKDTMNSKTGTQNRPYNVETLIVRATIHTDPPQTWDFNWNDRESVRRFAADSDRAIRAGHRTTLVPLR